MDKESMIFGMRPVLEAIKAGKELNKVMVQKNLQGELWKQLRDALRGRETIIQAVPPEKFLAWKDKNHQGVMAFLSPIEYMELEFFLPNLLETGKVPALMMLDRITDVRNFGAIGRSASLLGVDALIIPDRGTATVTADAIKTSAGTLMHLPVCREKLLKQSMFYLQQSGIKMVACTEKGTTKVWDEDLTGPVCIILGSEEDGISSDLLKKADSLVEIPMSSTSTSLNVSVSAGIVLYEMYRQRFF